MHTCACAGSKYPLNFVVQFENNITGHVRVLQVAQSLFPSAKAVFFGSQPCGLSLPGSDLDLVILGVPPRLENPTVGFTKEQRSTITENLKLLLKALCKRGLVSQKHSYVVAKAKVPIIKCYIKVRTVQHLYFNFQNQTTCFNNALILKCAFRHIQPSTFGCLDSFIGRSAFVFKIK